MTAAIFGLLGVLVGGILQHAGQWWMERRRESWAAKKSGRLFGPCLNRCGLSIDFAIDHADTVAPVKWADMCNVIKTNLTDWPHHSEVFAGTLSFDQWDKIYAAVRGLEKLTMFGVPGDGSEPIAPDDVEYLQEVMAETMEGWVNCMILALSGTGGHRVRRALRRVWHTVNPRAERREMEKLFGRGGKYVPINDDGSLT